MTIIFIINIVLDIALIIFVLYLFLKDFKYKLQGAIVILLAIYMLGINLSYIL